MQAVAGSQRWIGNGDLVDVDFSDAHGVRHTASIAPAISRPMVAELPFLAQRTPMHENAENDAGRVMSKPSRSRVARSSRCSKGTTVVITQALAQLHRLDV
jgi:hypothetical protein